MTKVYLVSGQATLKSARTRGYWLARSFETQWLVYVPRETALKKFRIFLTQFNYMFYVIIEGNTLQNQLQSSNVHVQHFDAYFQQFVR